MVLTKPQRLILHAGFEVEDQRRSLQKHSRDIHDERGGVVGVQRVASMWGGGAEGH